MGRKGGGWLLESIYILMTVRRGRGRGEGGGEDDECFPEAFLSSSRGECLNHA